MEIRTVLSNLVERNRGLFTFKKLVGIFIGTAIGSFGIYNIHQQVNITEGGVLGMILLLNHWTGLSPAILTPILDALCYAVAFKYLGWNFIKVSAVSTLSLAGFFKFWEQFPPVLPDLSAYPLVAAVIGGVFVGVAVGLIVRQGGSSGGDDALVLVLAKVTRCRIARAYLLTDFSVLLLSLSYIPLGHMGYSLVTVTVSSLLIDFVQGMGAKESEDEEETWAVCSNESNSI